jgi:hypothetical protein
MKDHYNENYKTFKKEIKQDTRRWKEVSCSWIGRINITKKNYTTKSNIQIQCNAHQYPNVILHRNRKINPKIHTEEENTPKSTVILRKKTMLKALQYQTSNYTTEP